jgi:hypothetical protein
MHPAYCLVERDGIASPPDAFIVGREFAHLHHPHDGSLHVVLPPCDVGQVVKMGWAELHPVAAQYGMPLNVVMLYAPRDASDLAVVCALIERSWRYAHGELGGRPVVDALYRARNDRDREGYLRLMDPNVAYEDVALGVKLCGHADVGAFIARSERSIDDLRFEVVSSLTTADRFSGEVVMSGLTNRPVGDLPPSTSIRFPFAVTGTHTSGVVDRISEFYDGRGWGDPSWMQF